METVIIIVLLVVIVKSKRENRRLLKAQEEMAKQVSEEIWTLAKDIVFLCDRGAQLEDNLSNLLKSVHIEDMHINNDLYIY